MHCVSSFDDVQHSQSEYECLLHFCTQNAQASKLASVMTFRLGGYHFLPNKGGHEKARGSQNFFMKKKRGHKNNQEIIGWLQSLLEILFNEIK